MLRFLAACVLTLTVFAEPRTATRSYVSDGGTNYVAEFSYDDQSLVIRTSNIPIQPHYPAKFDLYRNISGGRLLIASGVHGEYTEKGCFEDSLESLFYAITQEDGNKAANPVAGVGQAIHFAEFATNIPPAAVTNWVQANVIYAQKNVPVAGPGARITNALTIIVDWLLTSEWFPDLSTNYDAITHHDTNRYSSNLVVTVVYPGSSNRMLLDSRWMTNELRAWHWQPPVKVYDK